MRELHLFAGIGGGILGGALLGHTTVCAVEIDAMIEMREPPTSALVVVKAMKEIACGVAVDGQRQIARPAESATCPACQEILAQRAGQRRKAGV